MPSCNSFLRRALREAVEEAHPDLQMETRKDDTYDRELPRPAALQTTWDQSVDHSTAPVPADRASVLSVRCDVLQACSCYG